MKKNFINAEALINSKLHKNVSIQVEDGKITRLFKNGELPTSAGAETIDCAGNYLVPGYIDTQVNGGGGLLLNDAPTVDTIRTIAKAHRLYGTTAIMPTLISDDFSVIKEAIKATDAAINEGVPGVIGIHLEGPFLNPRKCGVHDREKFAELDHEAVELLSSLKNGKTLITLAPECNDIAHIAELTKRGMIVNMGHTNATYEQAMQALEAGVSGFTHLFNAMSAFESRAPGVVGAALLDDYSWCGIIVDGYHVSDASLKLALQAKSHEKFVLVTDAMSCVGTDQSSFTLQDKTILVEDGRCTDENGTLAGSNLDMASAVRNTHKNLELPLITSFEMASINPARYIGLEHKIGRIAIGYDADLALVDKTNLNVKNTWIAGK